ncbi:MAG TPA: glutamine--fructose-6-phosphate transaminase (isomerizing) [Anaerolineae bacterium]|nr:glutamine--fructose-6-phosphate transaminase (isomerizing) [Anaerolineae bacterium]
MCGIFGIITDQEQTLGPTLIESGKRLAYRGYDSVGCATVAADGTIDLRKGVGRIKYVSADLDFPAMRGLRGITQLRWATFGAPSYENAQPHLDSDGDMVGAHNGNVVNNVQMRELFIREGLTVRGTNDGETCVHAVERHFNRKDDRSQDHCARMVAAIRAAYDDLEGDYAFVITHRDDHRLYAIKKGSGLVAGLGEGLTCVSSDLPSILPITRRILRIRDGEIVVLSPQSVELYSVHDGTRIDRTEEWYDGPIEIAEKGGYPHFMLKEIHEQPVLAGELLHLLNSSPHTDHFLDALTATGNRGDARPLYLVGCGTSYHACLLGAYYFNQLAHVAAVPVLGPQFIEQYGESVGREDTAIFVSQSGETKDVLNAVKVMHAREGRVLGVLNVLGSTLMHQSDVYLPLACGYEISVPATKTFLNQVVLFLYLAYRLAGRSAAELGVLPDLLERTIEATDAQARQVAAYLNQWEEMYYLGYGLTHPIALEGALKLKEITYAHCEGIFSSEFKHGPLSAVHDGYPVLFITAPGDEMMMINHVNEVTTRGGRAIALAAEHPALRSNIHDYLVVPEADRFISPILATVPAQLVAYHMSVARGIDPDFPRNLSKTLTVD